MTLPPQPPACTLRSVGKKTPDTIERGKRLREAREAMGLLQEALAKKAGVPRPTLSAHENGASITLDMAKRYAPIVERDPLDFAEVISPSLLERMRQIEELLVMLVPITSESPSPDDETVQEALLQRRADLVERNRQARRVLVERTDPPQEPAQEGP